MSILGTSVKAADKEDLWPDSRTVSARRHSDFSYDVTLRNVTLANACFLSLDTLSLNKPTVHVFMFVYILHSAQKAECYVW